MTPSIQHSCRLMQDFAAVRPVDAKNDLRAIRVDGRPLVFSIGTDDILSIIYQKDDKPGQGWTRHPLLGLNEEEAVTAFGVAQDPVHADRFRLAACLKDENGDNFLCVSRLVDFDVIDWTDADVVASIWTQVDLPDPEATGNEVRIDRNGSILIATTNPPDPAKYYLYDPNALSLEEYGLPEDGANVLQMALGSLYGEQGVFLLYDVGDSARTLLFQSFPDPFFGRTFKERFDVDGTVNDFFVVPDSFGNDVVYTCGDSVYRFFDPTQRETIVSSNASDGMTFDQVRAVRDDSKITLWLLGSSSSGDLSREIYYVTNQYKLSNSITTERWTQPLPMMKNVGVFACEREIFISNHLFVVTDENVLRHLYQDAETTLWKKETIALEDSGSAEEISAYVVTARFRDLPKGKTCRVKISATSSVYASVNESSVVLGPRKTVWVDVTEDPEISVSIPVEDLAVPNVVFTADFLPEETVIVDCTARVLEDMKQFKTGEALKNAVATDGKPVFDDEESTPSEESLHTLAQVSQKVVQTAEDMKSASKPSASLPSSDGDEENVADDLRNTSMTVSVAEGEAALSTSSVSPSADSVRTRSVFSSFGNAIGDVIHSVAEGFARIGKWIVETSKNGLKVVIDLGGRLVTLVLEAYEQVVGVLGALFSAIKVGWEKLKRLLSFLFNFKDIIRTKEIIMDTVNGMFGALRVNMRYVKEKMNELADDAKEKLGAGELNDAIEKSLGDATVDEQAGAGNEAGEKDEASKSSESNWMGRKVRQSAKSGSGDAVPSGDDEDLFDELSKVWTDSLDNLLFIKDTLLEMIRKLAKGKITIAEFLIEILKAIGAVIVDTVQNMANVFFSLVDLFLEAVIKLMNKKFRLPIISSLYEKFTGKKLRVSMLEIIAFIAAVPATVSYKLVTGRVPHQDISQSDLHNCFEGAVLGDEEGEEVVTSRSAPTSIHAVRALNEDSTDDPSDGDSKSEEPSRKEVVKGFFGVLGGFVATFRSMTLTLKLVFPSEFPGRMGLNFGLSTLKRIDLVLALIVGMFSMARQGLSDASAGRTISLCLVTTACMLFMVGLYEVGVDEANDLLGRKKFSTKGYATNIGLSILGIVAAATSVHIMKERTVESRVTVGFGMSNWILAGVHHIANDFFKGHTVTILLALSRGALVLGIGASLMLTGQIEAS